MSNSPFALDWGGGTSSCCIASISECREGLSSASLPGYQLHFPRRHRASPETRYCIAVHCGQRLAPVDPVCLRPNPGSFVCSSSPGRAMWWERGRCGPGWKGGRESCLMWRCGKRLRWIVVAVGWTARAELRFHPHAHHNRLPTSPNSRSRVTVRNMRGMCDRSI